MYSISISFLPDSVKIAVKSIMDSKPDLIISGINVGANVGQNLLYSGTISAASEGTLLGIPSIAISLDVLRDMNFSTSKVVAKKIASLVINNGLPKYTLLNVNGCDSIVTLDLTIFNTDSVIDIQQACGSLTWIDGIMRGWMLELGINNLNELTRRNLRALDHDTAAISGLRLIGYDRPLPMWLRN